LYDGRQTLGDDPEQAIDIGQLLRRQDREDPAHCLLSGTGYLGQQAGAFVAEPAIDYASVVGAVAADCQATPFDAIDEFRGGGIGDAQHIGELADRDRPGLAEDE
jgi:hypothetical protein